MIESVDNRPKGGQQVGVMPVTVKITHIPTKISATCGFECSQYKNRAVALAMIEYGLTELNGN